MSGKRLVWVAGETSGDLIAGPILQALNAGDQGIRHAGIGGPAMRDAGLDTWVDIQALSVRGYAEVVRVLPRLLKLRRDTGSRILADRPAMFVGVDAPDFNFGLERRLRSAGVRCAHLVGPSVWAWRAGRLKSIRECVDHMLLLFPFEKPLYDRAGIPASYIGHPLADEIVAMDSDPIAARLRLGLDPAAPTIAILPGSRGAEIRYMGEVFLEAARWMYARRHDIQFVVPAANPSLLASLRQWRAALGMADSGHLHIVDGQARDAMAACDTALVASGTATLELALFGKPMVIAYRMAPMSYQLMRRMGYLPYVGLPNILANDWVVPEFIQHAATPTALGSAVLAQLDDQAACARIASRFLDLRAELAIGSAQRAAQVLEQCLSD